MDRCIDKREFGRSYNFSPCIGYQGSTYVQPGANHTFFCFLVTRTRAKYLPAPLKGMRLFHHFDAHHPLKTEDGGLRVQDRRSRGVVDDGSCRRILLSKAVEGLGHLQRCHEQGISMNQMHSSMGSIYYFGILAAYNSNINDLFINPPCTSICPPRCPFPGS